MKKGRRGGSAAASIQTVRAVYSAAWRVESIFGASSPLA